MGRHRQDRPMAAVRERANYVRFTTTAHGEKTVTDDGASLARLIHGEAATGWRA